VQFELRRSDILSSLRIRFVGQLVVTPGSGAVGTTRRWPYDLLQLVRYTANGAANIISVSGAKLKARARMKAKHQTDRGVPQEFGGWVNNATGGEPAAGVAYSGTLALASESWGVGSGVSNVPAGTYDVDLVWDVPVAEDDIDLTGASFLATSSSSLTLNLDFTPPAGLFVTTGGATVSLTGMFDVVSKKYSVPTGADGQIIVPDLSTFHSMIQARSTNIQAGLNEVVLIGQGAGKTMLRMFGQLWNGAGAASAPLSLSSRNFGPISWGFGGAEQPETHPTPEDMRYVIEGNYDVDLGGPHGFLVFDFACENTFRDVVDLGTVADLRWRVQMADQVALASPALEYVVETLYLAGQTTA
jgi:hypothetical protein